MLYLLPPQIFLFSRLSWPECTPGTTFSLAPFTHCYLTDFLATTLRVDAVCGRIHLTLYISSPQNLWERLNGTEKNNQGCLFPLIFGISLALYTAKACAEWDRSSLCMWKWFGSSWNNCSFLQWLMSNLVGSILNSRHFKVVAII